MRRNLSSVILPAFLWIGIAFGLWMIMTVVQTWPEKAPRLIAAFFLIGACIYALVDYRRSKGA